MTSIVLLGSAFLPALVLQPLADALRDLLGGERNGVRVAVVAPTDPRSAEAALAEYAAACAAVPGPVWLLAHSNAGHYVPALVAAGAERVAGALFVDAVLPPLEGGTSPLVPAELRAHLPGSHDRAAPWTRWWPDGVVRALFPDDVSLARIDALAPAVATAYLDDSIVTDPRWADGLTAAYLAFGETYAEEIERARGAGWPVRRLEGLGHLGILRDPPGVACAVVDLMGRRPGAAP